MMVHQMELVTMSFTYQQFHKQNYLYRAMSPLYIGKKFLHFTIITCKINKICNYINFTPEKSLQFIIN